MLETYTQAVATAQVDLRELSREMELLRYACLTAEDAFNEDLERVHPLHEQSARNLLHYLSLRGRDIRTLQVELASLGLSSLGRTEAHVLDNLTLVQKNLHALMEVPFRDGLRSGGVDLSLGHALLQRNTDRLLGPARDHRATRIMVTMPSEAGEHYELVRELVMMGMDCMRINCAHDGPETWARMVENLVRARTETGRSCRLLMDLSGPKLRTGALMPGPEVRVWHPARDIFGRVTAPVRVLLVPQETPLGPTPLNADVVVPVDGEFLSPLHAGDLIEFIDARRARRTLKIVGDDGSARWAESLQTCYLVSGLPLRSPHGEGQVGRLQASRQPIELHVGDTLILTQDPSPGQPARRGEDGALLAPARIPCTLPEVFHDVKAGEAIWFDDGKIGGIVREASGRELHVEIVHAKPEGSHLEADKGINLPDSALRLGALTAKDRQDLEFVGEHADSVGLSFVQRPSDVHELLDILEEIAGDRVPGVVLKIETRRAFEQLPRLVLAAMRHPTVGVMIARGDLAVECGYKRLAELQEEMLWLCEAAHVPVVWATQVLEKLAKKGIPSRAEITDAAMGERAECVMLNKGPHILAAVRTLDDILVRMQEHQRKKAPTMRRLKSWSVLSSKTS